MIFLFLYHGWSYKKGLELYYPDEIIEEVRSKNDIVDVIGNYVRLKKAGSNYFGLCPFHSEKSPSFSVSGIKQMYYCFGCGAGGNVISFVMNYENCTFQEALRMLAERAGVKLPEPDYSEEAKRRKNEKDRLFALNKDAASFYYKTLRSPEGALGLKYFNERRLSKETMRSFGLGYAGQSSAICRYLKSKGYTDEEIIRSGLANYDERRGLTDRFWNRVIFPIMDIQNRVIGFGGRVMGDAKPKYLNSPETPIFDKGKNLYGLNEARRTRKGYMIACEGYMDVISMHQAGFKEAVASLGTAFTPDHARILKRYTDDVRLTYDSDEAGIKAAMRAIPILKSAGISSKIIHLEPYKDPDEFIKNKGPEEFQKRIDNAENSMSFEIHNLQKKFDIGDPEGRTKFELAMAKRLSEIPDELERDNYTESFAAEYVINSEALKRAVAAAKLNGEGVVAAPVRAVERREKKGNAEREDGVVQAEKLLLTYITDNEDVYAAVKPYLSPEDFSDGMYREIASALWNQLEEGKMSPATIVSRYTEADEQRKVAEIFNTKLDEELSKTQRATALTELVVKIKKASLARISGQSDDPLARMVQEKRTMEKLQQIKITL
ncbi:DNA primase [Lachnospiraceae bacterium KH1T2]|nr:DNA primase [Lachnospiraceae bacterium KH1T2]